MDTFVKLPIILVKKCLCFETRLFLSMVLCFAAMIAPILIILGLKYGIVETLKERVLSQPEALQVTVKPKQDLTEEEICMMREWPEVGFLAPLARHLSFDVHVRATENLKSNVREPLEAVLVASGKQDPVLLRDGIEPPSGQNIVLSQRLADHLGVKSGENVDIMVWRMNKGTKKWHNCSFTVSGILPHDASDASLVYVDSAIVREVEAYKENRGSELFHAPFVMDRPASLFTGIVIKLLNTDSKKEDNPLQNHAQFVRYFAHEKKLDLLNQQTAGLWENQKGGNFAMYDDFPLIDDEMLKELSDTASSAAQVGLWGWNPPCPIELNVDSSLYPVTVCGISPEQQREWDDSLDSNQTNPQEKERSITLYAGNDFPNTRGVIRVPSVRGKESVLDARVIRIPGILNKKMVYCSAQDMGLVTAAKETAFQWDGQTGTFRLLQRSYAGVRLYASSIDDLQALISKAEQQLKAEAFANMQEVNHIINLNRNLEGLFYHLSLISSVGVIISLTLNLLNGLDRRIKEYSLLRMMGVKRLTMMALPFYEACSIVAVGFTVALGAFYLFKHFADRMFGEELMQGESYCVIPAEIWMRTFIICIGIAVVVALFSAIRIYRIDPATAMRSL